MTTTANQSITPVTCKRNSNGTLEIGECKIPDLIKEFGSPLMVFDEKTIRNITSAFKDAFKNTDIHMMFASKAFMPSAICKIMKQEKFGLDCVSLGELFTAKNSGFDLKNVVFNGNNKTVEELEFAIAENVGLISVDNFLEAKRINEICEKKNKTAKILLRITPGIECHTHEYIQTGQLDSKFGFDLIKLDEIIKLIVSEYKNLELVGLHAHLGSQIFQTDVYHDAIKIIMQETKRIREMFGIELSCFNIGGGAGIMYTKKDTPVSIYEMADVIKNAFDKYSKEYDVKNPHLYIEPGRCIVGTAGVTVYTVGSIKAIPELNKKYVAVDGGMADNIRPALYGAEYTVEAVEDLTDRKTEIVTIAGKYCESGDLLAKNIELPELKENDLICFFDTGAYGYSMASNYNKAQRPAVVLVNDGQADLIIKRESLQDLVKNDCIPQRLQG